MTNSTRRYLRKNIRKYRKLLGYTQQYFSEIVNLSTDYISEIERGKKCPSLDTIDTIATALNIPVMELFREND